MKRSAALAAIASLLAPVAFARPARADEAEGGDDAPTFATKRAIEVTLGTSTFYPSLANARFSGSGTPDGGPTIAFDHRGREVGLDAPAIWTFDLAAHYRHGWFSVGILGFVGGHPGGPDAAPDPPRNPAAGLANAGSLLAVGGGLDVAGVFTVSRFVSMRFGPLVGLRGFELPLTGVPDACSGDAKPPCHATASADVQVFVQPRVRVLISPPHAQGAFCGFSVGDEIVGGGFAASLFVGVSTTSRF